MNPPKSILDRSYRYTSSAQTDLRRTFARIRREQKEQRDREQANLAEAARVVTALPKKGACIPSKQGDMNDAS